MDSTHHWRSPVSALILTLLVALTAACKRWELPQAASGERGGLHREPREYGTEKASIPSDSTDPLLDRIAPDIVAFDVRPRVSEGPVTISWTVSERGHYHIMRVGVLRAADLGGRPDSDTWVELLPLRMSSPPMTGSLEDIPPPGISWYSFYAVDPADNVGFAARPIMVTSSRIRGGPWDFDVTFADVPYAHWGFDDVELLVRGGYPRGCHGEERRFCPDVTVRRSDFSPFDERVNEGSMYVAPDPQQELTRREGIELLFRMLHSIYDTPRSGVGVFADVKEDNESYWWAEMAFHEGWLAPCEPGLQARFCPDRPLSRAMAAHMVVVARALDWTAEPSPPSIRMIDTENGWATSGRGLAETTRVLRTADGGKTWQDVTPPVSAVHEVVFLDSLRAWVPLSGEDGIAVWRTLDGGQSWERNQKLPGSHGTVSWMGFVDQRHGWLATRYGFAGMLNDGYALYRTWDGGSTWHQLYDQHAGPLDCRPTAFVFADKSAGWRVTACPPPNQQWPLTAVTGDGGGSWSALVEVPLPETEPRALEDLTCRFSPFLFTDSSAAMLVDCFHSATEAPNEYFLYRTFDGGQTWSRSMAPGNQVLFINPEVVVLMGYDMPQARGGLPTGPRTLYGILDGEQAWEKLSEIAWTGQFSFVDLDHGWALAVSGAQATLLQTADGGRTWRPVNPRMVSSMTDVPAQPDYEAETSSRMSHTRHD